MTAHGGGGTLGITIPQSLNDGEVVLMRSASGFLLDSGPLPALKGEVRDARRSS
jgi:hypothetical protein